MIGTPRSRSAEPADDGGGRVATPREMAMLARPAARQLALASALGAGAIGAGIGLIAVSAWLISRASQHPPESALALAIVAVQFFGLSKGLLRYGQRLIGHDAAFRALADLRVRVYIRLEALAPAGLPLFRSGDLLARFVDDVESLQDLLVRGIQPFATAALVGATTVVLVWLILPAAGLILLLALALTATVLPWLTGALARRGEVREAEARGELTAATVDLVHGAAELRANGAIDAQLARTQALDSELARVSRARARTAGVGQGLGTLLFGLAVVGSLLVGITAVHAGRMGDVMLAVIALVPLAAFELGAGLPAAAQVAQRSRRSLGRSLAVLTADPPVREPADPHPVGGAPHALRVREVRFRYHAGTPWALDGVDLDLRPGTRVAVVGHSGAGKSTLADVLLRFLAYDSGSVTLDGIELGDIAGDECRRVVGLVAQDAHIFNGTIEANLRVARSAATRAELREALQRARLLDWIEGLSDGLGTEVGEFGSRMSGGQRQRLAVARALLARFPILILDEPGEHLETNTADAILGDLLDATTEQALVLITHRLAGLDRFDEVIVLDAGRVVERGTHAELLARGDGAYAEMWRRERRER
jgi:thiol reductant ABC exporter CydC subunit